MLNRYTKKMWKIILMICGVGLGLYGLLKTSIFIFINRAFDGNEAGSIGIIGGADGPTAIFITTKPGFEIRGGIACIIGAIVIGVLLFYMKKRKK